MSSVSWSFILALAALPLTTFAQEKQQRPDPAAAAAVVPAPLYRSAMASDRPANASDEQTPDSAWRDANRVVGELAGHGGHLAANAGAPADGHTGRGAHLHRPGE